MRKRLGNPKALQRWYDSTDAAAAEVQTLASGIGDSFPANIQAKAATVRSAIPALGTCARGPGTSPRWR